MVNGMRSLSARVLGVSAVAQSIQKALCIARPTIAKTKQKRARLNTIVKKINVSLQRGLKRRNCEKGIELGVCLECEDEYNR